MAIVTLGSKGQRTIPRQLRDVRGQAPGAKEDMDRTIAAAAGRADDA